MADVSKLKKLKGRRDELGAPPTLDEASTNLTAPEVAPVARPAAANPPATATPTPASATCAASEAEPLDWAAPVAEALRLLEDVAPRLMIVRLLR